MAGSLTKPNTVNPSSKPKLFTRKMREMIRNETTAVVRHKRKMIAPIASESRVSERYSGVM